MTTSYGFEFSFVNDSVVLIGSSILHNEKPLPYGNDNLVYEGESASAKIKIIFNRRSKQTTITLRQLRPDERGQGKSEQTEAVMGNGEQGDSPTDEGRVQTYARLGQLLGLLGLLANRREGDGERWFDSSIESERPLEGDSIGSF